MYYQSKEMYVFIVVLLVNLMKQFCEEWKLVGRNDDESSHEVKNDYVPDCNWRHGLWSLLFLFSTCLWKNCPKSKANKGECTMQDFKRGKWKRNWVTTGREPLTIPDIILYSVERMCALHSLIKSFPFLTLLFCVHYLEHLEAFKLKGAWIRSTPAPREKTSLVFSSFTFQSSHFFSILPFIGPLPLQTFYPLHFCFTLLSQVQQYHGLFTDAWI